MAPSRLDGLDALRGLAVTAVVAYHLGYLRGGFLGVDVFFVLSGFLVTSLALNERDRRGHLDLRAFWGRRLRRLGPALALMVPLVVAAALWLDWPRTARGVLGWDAASALTWWANWRQAFGDDGGYWAAGTPRLFRHAWSLSVEEQFYVLWPLALTLAFVVGRSSGRAVRRRTVALAATAAAGSAIWSVVLAHRIDAADLSRVYVGTDTRLATPLVGCLVAAFLHRRPGADRARSVVVPRDRAMALAIGGAAAVVLGVLMLGIEVSDPALYRSGLLPAVAVLAAGVVAGAAAVTRTDPVTRWLGRRSYGIYLWSWPVQMLLTHHDPGRSKALTALLTVPIVLLLAEVSWRLVESPVLTRRGWVTVAPLRRAGVAVAVLAAVAAIAVPLRQERRSLFQDRGPISAALDAAHRAPTEAPPGSPGAGGVSVALFGDSVALTLALTAPPAGDIPGIRSIDAVPALGCPLLASSGYQTLGADGRWLDRDEDCGAQDDMETLALARHPDVVVIEGGPWELLSFRAPDGTVLDALSSGAADAIVADLVATAARVDGVGGRTLLLSFACPGAAEDPAHHNAPSYLSWYDHLLRRAVAEGTAKGYDIAVLEPTDKVCVDADPAGTPTPEKDRAFGGEFHIADPAGGHWAWLTWLGPAITGR